MKKTFIRLFLILAMAACCPSLVRAGGDASAKEVLDRVSAVMKKGGIEAFFTFVPYRQGMPQAGSSGRISIDGEKFHLVTDDILTWFDGRTQWSYLTVNDEVNISHPTREELQGINPLILVSLYEHGYHYAMGQSSAEVDEVILTAEDSELPIDHLIIQIDKTTQLPRSIKLKEAGRDYTLITIESLKQGMKWKKDYFVFKKEQYPHAEVVDLR